MTRTQKIGVGIIFVILLIIAGTWYFTTHLVPPNKESPEIEYYTCAMHPSVKEKNPGQCPICGMDLIPVITKVQPDSVKTDLTFHIDPEKIQLIGVKYATAQIMPFHKTIRAAGRVDYNETQISVVNLKYQGWIKNLYADYTGQLIKKGQALFDIYNPDLLTAQYEYLGALENMESLELADQESPEIKPAKLKEVKEILASVRQRLLLWDFTDEQITQIEKVRKPTTLVTVYSPIDGFVINKMALAGMYVEPGMELYKIANLSTVWVYADIYEYEVPYVSVGQDAEITLRNSPEEIFKGKITYIFPYLNAETRTSRVRIQLTNRNGKIKPEMYANVKIESHLGEKLGVSEDAVINTGERQIVFVDKGEGLLEARLVQIGVAAAGFVEIKDGLKLGDKIISQANFLIDAESKIQGVLQRLEGDTMRMEIQEQPPVHIH